MFAHMKGNSKEHYYEVRLPGGGRAMALIAFYMDVKPEAVREAKEFFKDALNEELISISRKPLNNSGSDGDSNV